MYVKYGYSLSASAVDGVHVCYKHFSSAPGSVCVRLRDRVCVRRAQFCVREDDIRGCGASVREHQALCTYAQGIIFVGAGEV